jgi:hypothetical protein
MSEVRPRLRSRCSWNLAHADTPRGNFTALTACAELRYVPAAMSTSIRTERLGTAALAFTTGCLLVVGSTYAQEVTRADYIAQADPICAKAEKAGARMTRRVNPLIRQERFREAAAIYERYWDRAYKPAVRKLARIPRPPADAATLSREFEIRWREARLSQSVQHHMRRGNVPAMSRVNRRIQNLDRRADSLLRPLGFRICDS